MTRQTIQQTEAWRLDVELIETKWGATVRFISFVPSARRPEEQVKLQLNLSHAELETLQKVLSEAVASATI
jgi:hypothetical protein